MGNDYVREISRLKMQLKIALLRADCIWFTYKVPEHFTRNRTRSAYDSGYESGWRGWEYKNGYSRPHFQSAYFAGYNDATQDLMEKALRIESTEKGTQG